jgi:parvulin-like peptidyl-prolyl isomerase
VSRRLDVRARPTVLVLTLALAAALAPPAPASAEVVDRIIATVNNQIVTLSDFYVAVPIFVQLNQVPPQVYSSRDGRRMLATRVLQELVNRLLLTQEADRHSLDVERSAVDNYIALISRQMGATVDELEAELRGIGIDFRDFHEYIRYELTKLRVINVMVQVSVSDAEIDALFLERYPEGAVSTAYDVSQILLVPDRDASPEALAEVQRFAEELRQRLLRGEDFEALASEHSQGPARARGGHMGVFQRGQLPEEFESVAYNLLPGEISEVFRTRFGFHIVRLNDRVEESVAAVDDIREEIYRDLQQRKQQHEVERFMAQLHSDNIVIINFNPAELY